MSTGCRWQRIMEMSKHVEDLQDYMKLEAANGFKKIPKEQSTGLRMTQMMTQMMTEKSYILIPLLVSWNSKKLRDE